MKRIYKRQGRAEDRTAMIFVCITLTFIISHIPRLILDSHELINLDIANACQNGRMKDIAPAWTFILIYISHFCLALNATLNMVIYGFMSGEFRKELKSFIDRIICWQRVVVVWNLNNIFIPKMYVYHQSSCIKNLLYVCMEKIKHFSQKQNAVEVYVVVL